MQLELARVDQALGEGRSRSSNDATSHLPSLLGWLSFLLKPFPVEGEKVNFPGSLSAEAQSQQKDRASFSAVPDHGSGLAFTGSLGFCVYP